MARNVLTVPHFSQLDNAFNPYGSCNVTSVAMCMAYYGIVGNGQGQLEDQLYQFLRENKMSRHNPYDLARLFPTKGLKDMFTSAANWKTVREWIDTGNPCITHGYFTRFGHIVVIVGYDDEAYDGKGAWIINDPYGEYHDTGYDNSVTGKELEYSYGLMNRLCSPDGQLWIHFVSKP